MHFKIPRALFSCHLLRKLRLTISFIFYLGAAQSAFAEKGIVAWKESPSEPNTMAKVFYFDRMEATGPITLFYQGGQRKSFEKGQHYDMVILPGSLDEISSKMGSDGLNDDYKKLSAFSEKYPAAKVMLKPRLEQMSMYLTDYTVPAAQVDGKKSAAPKDRNAKVNQDAVPKDTEPKVSATHWVPPLEVIFAAIVYLIVLMLLTLWRKRTLILMCLLLPFVAGFGWLTYQEQGIAWVKKIPDQVREVFTKSSKK